VLSAQQQMEIKYSRNHENLGPTRNFLKAVEMAEGEFVWLIGDDDLLLPDAISRLVDLISKHPESDFFYINSCHLDADYLDAFPHPFCTANLPMHLNPFSPRSASGELMFMDLVDPEISFDFLGGIFLSVFRREIWLSAAGMLDAETISNGQTFSHIDNTFPHLKIYARAFANSRAFFFSRPLSVCLTGVREWAPMYPLVRSIRLVEALKEYRANGLPVIQYLKCRNYALKYFIPDLVSMFINRGCSGYEYINPLKLIASNCLYPNVYLSVVYYVARKLKNLFAT